MKKCLPIRFQMAFRWLHPDELNWRNTCQKKLISGDEDVTFLGEDNEWLILYSKEN
jgi:UDP-2,3-diacylglucosamine hydrolase